MPRARITLLICLVLAPALGTAAGCGTVHVLSGGGGASRYARDVTNTTLLAFADRVYQYVELTIGADRIRGRTFDRNGRVVDEFAVRRYEGTANGLPGRCSG